MIQVVKPPSPIAQAMTLAGQPSVNPLLRVPLSARPMRVLFARKQNEVAWVRVDAGGTGYATAPTVSFSGGGGAGAAAVALVRGGAVQAIAVTANGTNYTSAPTVSFSGGGGTSAAATAIRVDPLADAQSLGVTDLVWHYPNGDFSLVNSFKAAGISAQETINGTVARTETGAAALSWDGQAVPVAWLQPSETAFGASRRAGYLALKAGEAGALTAGTAAHFDDPAPDLSATRALSTSRTGGPFDAETLASFDPSYVAAMQAAGITQDGWNWATKAFSTATGNWATNYATAPNWQAFLTHLRAGVVQFHQALRTHYPNTVGYVSGNCYDPMPRRDYSGYLVRGFEAALFETDSDQFSTRVAEGTPANYAQRFTRLWLNIKTVTGAGRDCLPHLQPPLNDETYSSARTQQVTVLKQQIALSYALGGRPLYPYDTYVFPWAAGQNERWFAQAGDGFAPLFQFVADYPELFDGTSDNGGLLLACDVETPDQREVTDAQMLGWANVCLRNAVPAILYPLNGGYSRNTAAEAAAFRVIDCSSPSAVTAALSSLPNYRTIANQPIGTWAQWSAAKLSGTFADVFVIPRTKAGATVLHIVNMDGASRTGLRLVVQQWALPNRKLSRVRWFEPGQAPQEMSAAAGVVGLALNLPALSEWAVLLIEA